MKQKTNRSFDLQILVRVAILVAMTVLLMNYLGIHTQFFKIGFSFVPIALCGMMYGARWSAACAVVGDLINCLLGVWQGAGYGAIIYIATINGINNDLYEAACIDGASRWQRVWNITIPQIMPIVVMMFTMQIGLVFMTGFDKVLLIYMPSTYEFSDCLSTYTYRMAFGSSNDFGLSTASGLFQSVVGTILMVGGNKLSAMTTKHSMF